ncbi:MAG: SidA/IucD/PvdA family monooxygenase, partial [Rhodocyclaceae bacterium]
MRNIARLSDARRIAVIGAGQSAAEIFMDLHGRPNAPQVDLITRARAIKPADDSAFVNEIFNIEFVDHIYNRSPDERSEFLREFRHANYACADLELIGEIFKVFYEQKVKGETRHCFLRRHEITAVDASGDRIQLSLHDGNADRSSTSHYDAVVLATGYERQHHKTILEPLATYLRDFAIDRNYRLKSTDDFRPAVFLQGACEATHGLSDTLLSLTAVRTDEISDALLAASQGTPP